MREKVQSRVLSVFTENIPLKLLSLTFSGLIWAWVQSEQVIDDRVRIQVRYIWPDDLVRTTEVPPRVVATLRGPQGLLRTMNHSDLSMEIDLSEGVEGLNTLDFTTPPISGLLSSLEIRQITPPELDIELDRSMTRTVNVESRFVGELEDGWQIIEERIEPGMVEVTGPQSLIQNLDSIPTDVIDINGLTSSKTWETKAAPSSRIITSSWKESIRVHLEISPIIREKNFNEVPVVVSDRGWRADPETVHLTLRGPQNELTEMPPAARITVLAHLPDPAPSTSPILLQLTDDPVLLEISHPGSDGITGARIIPEIIKLIEVPEEEQ